MTVFWGDFSMDCPHCGALVQENQEICPACGGQVIKRSFWQKLLKFFSPVQVTRTKVIRVGNVELKGITFTDEELAKSQALADLPPDLRAKIQQAIKSGLPRLEFPNEFPPELRAKIEEALASGKTQYLTLNDIPDELRAKFQDAIASGQGVAKQVFSYQGPDGQMHTCQSLEEMPADIRDKLKEAIQAGQGDAKQVFSFQAPDGQKHVYHSLEEMPEGIRAFFRITSETPRQE
jgi:hypothetical protein